MKRLWLAAVALWSAALASDAAATELRVRMDVVSDTDAAAPAGTVTITETEYGLVFTPAMTGLAPGLHAFHVHEDGSMRDLPALYVDVLGNANNPVLAPRLKLSDLAGRALVVRVGEDECSGQMLSLRGRHVVRGVID